MNTENTAKPALASDEVDLGQAFISVIHFFVKNGSTLLLFILFGLGLGGGYYARKKNVYSSKLVAECQSLQDSRVVELLQGLDHVRENEDWELLGRMLNIKPEEAKNIKKIEPLSNVAIDKESKGVDDYLLNTHEPMYSFSVILYSKDNTLWPKFRDGIIHYLTENEYSKLRVSRFIENRSQLIANIDKELKKLDSLDQEMEGTLRFKKHDTPRIPTKNQNFSTIAYQINSAVTVELQEKKQIYTDELRFSQPVRVIMDFIPYKQPVEPDIYFSVGFGFLFGLVSGCIFIIIRSLAQLYRKNSVNQAI